MEIELKLLIEPADAPRLRRFIAPAGWSRSAPSHRKLLSIYFDTEDFFLKQRGIDLRVRRDGNQWIQTVKGDGNVKAGLHSRTEIEMPVAFDHFDFTKIDAPALRQLFSLPELQGRIKALFTTEFRRTIWMLESAHDDHVEMALDQGEIRAGQSATAINEVELELKTGNPAALYEIALALVDRVPLKLENASKAQRGYALYAPPPPPEPVKAEALDFKGSVSTEQAFQEIVWSCIGHLQCNYYGFLVSEDVEYVHQMRVAMRRLNSAFGLFAKIAPAIREVDLIGEVRWLAGELGAARDWDVFVTQTLPPILAHAQDEQALQELCGRARILDEDNREHARRAAGSPRYQKLLLRLGAWLYRASWRAQAGMDQLKMLDRPILDVSARLLEKRHLQLLKRGENIAGLTPPERHALRIAAKKLRYAAEFLAHLYPGAESRAYLGALAELQDILGVLNDHVVTRRLLEELQGKSKTDALLARSVGEVMGWNACLSTQHLADLDRRWDGFKSRKRFWKDEGRHHGSG